MKKLPDLFIKRFEMILPDIREFLDALKQPVRKAFRINMLKAPEDILERVERFGIEPVPWYERGFFAETSRLGRTLEHFLGYIYIQEASSMLPPAILKPEKGETILDAAASPGSKTTQMADMMSNSGLIIANDISEMRNKALVDNLDRLGVMNTVVVNMDARNIGDLNMEFDKALLDAPCSGEGMLRKVGLHSFHWSMKRVLSLSRLQKQMILSVFDSLKPGGRMVYSTCTGSPEENEEVVSFLLEKRENARIIKPDVNVKAREGVEEFGRFKYNPEVRKCLRIYPQDTGTEMFFACLIEKKS